MIGKHFTKHYKVTTIHYQEQWDEDDNSELQDILYIGRDQIQRTIKSKEDKASREIKKVTEQGWEVETRKGVRISR